MSDVIGNPNFSALKNAARKKLAEFDKEMLSDPRIAAKRKELSKVISQVKAEHAKKRKVLLAEYGRASAMNEQALADHINDVPQPVRNFFMRLHAEMNLGTKPLVMRYLEKDCLIWTWPGHPGEDGEYVPSVHYVSNILKAAPDLKGAALLKASTLRTVKGILKDKFDELVKWIDEYNNGKK